MMNFFSSKGKTNSATPVFYCENCGSEVPEDDNVCPNCKKRFAGVKCPRCFFEGSSADFENGCPRCHYDPKKDQRKKSARAAADIPLAQQPEPQDPRPRRRIFSSFTLVGILLIAITLVALLYMM